MNENAVSDFIIKAVINADKNSEMNGDQVADLSYDMMEVMEYETPEDVVLMFKMYRQGKIGNDKYRPMKSFNNQSIMSILVPEYMEKKAISREQKALEDKKNSSKKSVEEISKLGLNEINASDFKADLSDSYKIDKVTEGFKAFVGYMRPDAHKKYIERHVDNPRMQLKIEYVRNYSLNKSKIK